MSAVCTDFVAKPESESDGISCDGYNELYGWYSVFALRLGRVMVMTPEAVATELTRDSRVSVDDTRRVRGVG